MSDIRQLPVAGVASRPAPARIMRPCEYGLLGAVRDLETQMGSVEAQHAMWATDPKYIYPAGQVPAKPPKETPP